MDIFTDRSTKRGFTLIELMLVIVILGILAIMISGNLLTSLKRGRDSRRKQDLASVTKALELYYADFGHYPLTAAGSGVIDGCDSGGTSSCAWGSIFAATVGSNTTTYMVQLPTDPSATGGREYYYDSNGQYYQLYALLENSDDADINPAPNIYYDSTDCGGGAHCNYGIASVNALPETNHSLTSSAN